MRLLNSTESNFVCGGDAAATRPQGTNSWGEPIEGYAEFYDSVVAEAETFRANDLTAKAAAMALVTAAMPVGATTMRFVPFPPAQLLGAVLQIGAIGTGGAGLGFAGASMYLRGLIFQP